MKNEINMVDFKGSTLTILEGKAPDPINMQALTISGTIETVLRWISKKFTLAGEEEKKQICLVSNVTVNREKGEITLRISENHPQRDVISGFLEHHPDFTKWGINSGESMTSHDLAEFIKMNRSSFKNKEVAMKLVKDLRSFTAKVNKEMESFKDDRANYAMKRTQVVESNLPESFTLVVPIFKGRPKETIQVEININADNLSCSLTSPEVNDYIAEFKDKIIDEQISAIETVAPALVIIEV
jgi:hypothetical protein